MFCVVCDLVYTSAGVCAECATLWTTPTACEDEPVRPRLKASLPTSWTATSKIRKGVKAGSQARRARAR